jgi:hypothetical protein
MPSPPSDVDDVAIPNFYVCVFPSRIEFHCFQGFAEISEILRARGYHQSHRTRKIPTQENAKTPTTRGWVKRMKPLTGVPEVDWIRAQGYGSTLEVY